MLTKDQKKSYEGWRKRVLDSMPAIAQRIFSLRNVMYSGCGFHYSLESNLGYCLWKFQNVDQYPDSVAMIVTMEVIWEALCKNLKRAEQSATALQS